MQEIVIPSEEDAKAVREALLKLLDRYATVAVSDYLELVGMTSMFSDEKVGWFELGDIPIKSVSDGFMLELPKPVSIRTTSNVFPFLKGWWIVVDVPDDQKYEGRLSDTIGGMMILEVEPSKIRIGVPLRSVNKIDAYRERPQD